MGARESAHPWSKLKAAVERLWAPDLGVSIHCNAYTHATNHDHFKVPRHWFLLDGKVIWDFPGPFLTGAAPYGRPLNNFYDAVRRQPESAKPIPSLRPSYRSSTIVSQILREYVDRPAAALFEPFPDDEWCLTDILRAADRRLGRQRLNLWVFGLNPENPAHVVLTARCRAGFRAE